MIRREEGLFLSGEAGQTLSIFSSRSHPSTALFSRSVAMLCSTAVTPLIIAVALYGQAVVLSSLLPYSQSHCQPSTPPIRIQGAINILCLWMMDHYSLLIGAVSSDRHILVATRGTVCSTILCVIEMPVKDGEAVPL